MSLSNQSMDAIRDLAARFVFDDAGPAAQQELAQSIEQALSEWKRDDMAALVRRTLRTAIEQRIKSALEAWSRSHYPPVPLHEPETATRRRRRGRKMETAA